MSGSNPNIHQRSYRLVAYDDNWPKLYKKYADQIKDIIGENLLEIHHYGSTSVPGMYAKPNIDIYVLVLSLEKVRVLKDDMHRAGYIARGDYSNIGEEYFTLDKPDGERIASVHIFEGSNGVFIEYQNFHDYLIHNQEDRERYITLKKELYKKYKHDYPAYDLGKKELIKQITARANQWAARNSKAK